MQTLKRILVPVDFSECSFAAAQWATFLALRFNAEIDVLHVWNISALAHRDVAFPAWQRG